uniref:Protein kinase domain-containing protein n=1 Tax=Acrobeloides nanus TaxID=290746 RepID=A0A914DWY2_9BILA
MYISSINYVGPSSVKVLSTTYYNESYELFEFSEEESQYWRKLVIYGNLINFIIPPNGTLEIKYEALKTMNITEYDFEEYGLGVVQSSNYTMNVSIQYTPRIIRYFGLAVINNSSMKESKLPKRLPVRWLSIEAIVEKLFSEKSDVWAFGILMHEVFSMGQAPYPGIETGKLLQFLRSGERMSHPELATNEMYEMMYRCWKENVETRPRFEELVAKLHDVLEDESGYAKYYEELERLEGQEDGGLSDENNSTALEVFDADLL